MSTFISKYEAGKYNHNVEYPKKDDFFQYCPLCNKKEFDDEGFKKAKKKYYIAENEKYTKMKNEILDEHYLTNSEYKEIIWSKAYEIGHSSGFCEIYSYMYDVIDFVEKILKIKKESK